MAENLSKIVKINDREYNVIAVKADEAENALKLGGKSASDYALKSELEGLEGNVQSDWNVTDVTSDAFIKNKPTSLPANGGNADTVGNKSASDFVLESELGKALGIATLGPDGKVPTSQLPTYPTKESLGLDNVATLGADGKVPASQLPSYVDDIIEGTYVSPTEFKNTSGTPITGETGKIYVDTATNHTYRWSGSTFIEISSGEITYTNMTPTVTAFGGVAAGTSFNNMPITEVLDKLLYPYVAPIIGTTVSSPNNGGVFENGSTQTVTSVTSSVTKKSASISKVELLRGNEVLRELIGSAISNGGAINFDGLSVAINKDTDTARRKLTVKVTDSENKSYTRDTGTFDFVYPYYYGAITADTAISEIVVDNLTKITERKGNKAWTFTFNNQKAVFAYPKTYGKLKSIINQNNYEVLTTFTCYELSITGRDGIAQTYYVYVSNGASTLSNFKYTFNIQ